MKKPFPGLKWRATLFVALALALFGGLMVELHAFVALADNVPLVVRSREGGLTVDRRVLLARIRQDLSLGPESRVSVDPMPGGFRGPDGDGISATLSRVGEEGRGAYLYRMDVNSEGVVRESFYMHVHASPGEGALSPRAGKGAELKVPAGTNPKDDGEGVLVSSGDSVRITAKGKGFLIRFSGISQSGGGIGDQVSIINPVSGTRMMGIVTGRGRVLIHLPGSGS